MSTTAIAPQPLAQSESHTSSTSGPQPHAPADRMLLGVLITLTVVSGLVDATTYLGLGRVFAANMTGNIVLLGFALAGGGQISIVGSIIALVAFLVGAAAGGSIAHALEADRRRWILTVLVLETIGLGLATVSAALSLSGYVVVALLAVTMGGRNAAVRRLGVPDLTTTVLTLTLTGIAADAAAGGDWRRVSPRRIASVLAMLAGAFVGALLLNLGLAAPLALATCLVVGATVVSHTRSGAR